MSKQKVINVMWLFNKNEAKYVDKLLQFCGFEIIDGIWMHLEKDDGSLQYSFNSALIDLIRSSQEANRIYTGSGFREDGFCTSAFVYQLNTQRGTILQSLESFFREILCYDTMTKNDLNDIVITKACRSMENEETAPDIPPIVEDTDDGGDQNAEI